VLLLGLALLLGGLLIGAVGIPALARVTQGGAQGVNAGFTNGVNQRSLMGNGMMSGGMMSGGMMGDVDRHFIEEMIPHHQDAIDMAGLALQKAQHPELKALAADIKSGQSAEIDKMRAWYTDWYGMDVPTAAVARGMMGTGMGTGMGANMNNGMGTGMRNNASGLTNAKDFDKAFIVEMIPHHQMAVMMSTMVLVHGRQPELRELARSIINSQSAEIEKMRDWYRTWYGTAGPQP
jgi:uncharacterized protein (DUF305 family)